MRTCAQAAACFPGSLHVGVDLMFLRRLAAARGGRGQRVRRPAARGADRRPGHLRRAGARADQRPVDRSAAAPARPTGDGTAATGPAGRDAVAGTATAGPPTTGGPARRGGRSDATLIGSHDMLPGHPRHLRFDVAAELAAPGRTPNLARVLPGGRWERRHAPASFTYAAHQAFFAGFLPTPAAPGPASAAVRGARSPAARPPAAAPGSSTPPTCVDRRWPGPATTRSASAGSASSTGAARSGGAARPVRRGATGSRSSGSPPRPASTRSSTGWPRSLPRLPAERPLFTFLNVAALHQPNRHYLPGARAATAGTATPPRWSTSTAGSAGCSRCSPGAAGRCFAIVCSDHGTAYGEDGHTGHRIGHDVCGPSRTPTSLLRPGGHGDQHRHGPRRLAVPGLPLRVPAQDRVPAAAAPAAAAPTCGRAERPRRAVPLRAHAVLRDALRLLQPVHPGQRAAPSRSTRLPARSCAGRPSGSRDALGDDAAVRPRGVRRRHPDLS